MAVPGPSIRSGWIPLIMILLSTASAHAETFAQRPGFHTWFETNPPDPQRPGPAERRLLQRHRPILQPRRTIRGRSISIAITSLTGR